MANDPTNEFSQTDELDAAENTAVEPSPEPVSEKSDKAAEAAAAEKMNEIFGRNDRQAQADELEEEGLTGPNNPDGDTPDKPEDEEKPEADEGTEEAEETPEGEKEQTDEEKAEAAARKEVLDAFDPNLKRVAKELAGWKEQDIDDFIASNPTLARVTFSNMAAGYNALSLQYAQGARPGAPVQQPPAAGATQTTTSALDELLSKPEKLRALQEIAGDELMNAFIKPMLEERKAMLEDRAYVASIRREAVVREVNDSIAALAKDGFEEFYGKNGETTQDQANNRFKVGQLADQIRAGAQLQGVNMGIYQALHRAHLIVTADQNRAQARKEIVQQVKKRSTQLTARPTARRTTLTPPQKGDAAAHAAVENFWTTRGD